MNLLKEKTTSLCPECTNEIEAKVYEEGSMIYIYKACPEHGEFKALAESDAAFYKRVMHKDPPPKKYNILVVPVEYRCNMRCKYCYLPDRNQENISFGRLKDIVNNFPGQIISLSGGEPTLREDLPKIIKYISDVGKLSCLVTNGLKLVDPDYVKALKKAGLAIIVFSMNGFSEKSDANIYDMPNVTETKVHALNNLRGQGFYLILSATVGRGINEEQVWPLFEYSALNSDMVRQLRIRSVTPVGRYSQEAGFFTSELIKMFSDGAGLDKDYVVDNLSEEMVYNAAYHFRIRVYFMVENGKVRILPGVTPKNFLHTGSLKRALTYIKNLGPDVVIKDLISIAFEKPRLLRNLRIRFISWPDIYSVDLPESDRGLVAHLYNQNEILSFCHAILLNEKL